jgi:anaerobic magnesium-protoporphyrin IX monomethyl ester cyclase
MKVALVEPLVEHPIKINKNRIVGDVNTRHSLGFLAGYISDNSSHDVEIFPYRLAQLEGSERHLEQDLQDFDVIGITATTTEVPDALEIAKTAKHLNKTVVMGGLFPTSNSRYLLESPNIDFIVRGEGEEIFLQLLNAIEDKKEFSGIKGLSFKDKGNIVENSERHLKKDVDKYRSAIELMDLERYAKVVKQATLYSARGCEHQCTFCSLNKHWGFKHRKRSVAGVLDEMERYEKAGFEEVRIDDESFLADPLFGRAILEGMQERGFSLKYRLKSRLDELTDELLDLMKASGVIEIHFGLEAPVQAHLDDVKKGMLFNNIEQTLNRMDYMGFTLNPSFMLGLPKDTEAELSKTADYILAFQREYKKTDIYVNLYTAHPGTPIFFSAKNQGVRIVNTNLNEYTHWMLTTLPESLGDPLDALYIMEREQNRVVKGLNNNEPLVSAAKILETNPKLDHIERLPSLRDEAH